LVPDGAGGFRNFARIAFGSAAGLNPAPDLDGDPSTQDLPVTFELPAPVLFGTASDHSEISAAGDVNGDGYDDIAVSVTTGGTSTVYLVFGRPDAQWAAGSNPEQDAGLLGEYFYLGGFAQVVNFPDYDSLNPDLVRVDSQVNFPNTGGAFPGVGDSDVFAARWTGQIRIDTAGVHKFFLSSDDGSRLYIDDQLVVNNGGLHGFIEASGSIELSEGFHDIRVEMFENFGFAGVVLEWDPAGSTGRQLVPNNVLFRDARDVFNVLTDHDVALTGFTGSVSAAAAGDVTPVIGNGLTGEFYKLDVTADALHFDGGDQVAVPDSASLAMTGTSTVEVRFKMDSGATGWKALVHKTDGLGFGSRTYSLWANQSDGQLYLSTSDATGEEYWFLPAGTLQADQWYEFASVIDRTTGEVHAYLNGVEILDSTVRTGTAVATTNALLIGASFEAGVPGFTGVIDNVAIWNSARSATEVAADFAGGIDNGSTDLAGHWRFEETDGVQATDLSTYGNHGTLGGGSAAAVPQRFVGEVPDYPDFATLEATHSITDTAIGYGFVPDDFAGFDDLDDYFAARWTGKIVVDIPGSATSGNVTFAALSDARSRIYVDDVLVVDR
ncbi:MAG: hypothetical protein EHM55_25825, partial [Acidobacteria bacterium]